MFDPWTATFEEAKAAQDAVGRLDGPAMPLSQWCAVQEINTLRPTVEGGGGFDTMDAVSRCIRHDLVAPAWLARAFLRRYDSVLNCRVGSWDEAFGRPYPKRARMDIWRLRRLKRWQLLNYFNETGASRNDAGWRAAAEALGITPRQAEDWTPKTRKNARGHKPYKVAAEQPAHDPFGVATATKKPG